MGKIIREVLKQAQTPQNATILWLFLLSSFARIPVTS